MQCEPYTLDPQFPTQSAAQTPNITGAGKFTLFECLIENFREPKKDTPPQGIEKHFKVWLQELEYQFKAVLAASGAASDALHHKLPKKSREDILKIESFNGENSQFKPLSKCASKLRSKLDRQLAATL